MFMRLHLTTKYSKKYIELALMNNTVTLAIPSMYAHASTKTGLRVIP